MMLLFLGSGVSFASGLPSVPEITDNLLNGEFFYDPKAHGQFYPATAATGEQLKSVDRAQTLLNLLMTLDEYYLGAVGPYFSGSKYAYSQSIYRNTTSYEDLFHLSEQIRQSGLGLTDDAKTGTFVDTVIQKAGNLLDGDTRERRFISLYELSCVASSFIQWMVAGTLETKKITGLDLVLDLACSEDVDRLDIVTLNHDTLVEKLLTENGIPFEDGFGEIDGDVRWFEDSVYDSISAKIRIFKPHGSVDWYLFRGNQYPASVAGSDPLNCFSNSGEKLQNFYKMPSFLSGVDKILAYNRGIFSEIFYRFHQVLREHDFMVMSGYGWGDTAINFRLMNWLEGDRKRSIMLLYKDPNELCSRSLQLEESYRPFVKSGQLIPTSNYLSDTKLEDVENAVLTNRAR